MCCACHVSCRCHFLQVTLLKTLTREKYSFQCGRWLDVNEDDNEIIRELPANGALIDEPLPRKKQINEWNLLYGAKDTQAPWQGSAVDSPSFPHFPVIKYRVTICTGNVSGSGTDASVFLNIIGDMGDTGERLMIMSKNNVNKFEKGNVSASLTLSRHRMWTGKRL